MKESQLIPTIQYDAHTKMTVKYAEESEVPLFPTSYLGWLLFCMTVLLHYPKHFPDIISNLLKDLMFTVAQLIELL